MKFSTLNQTAFASHMTGCYERWFCIATTYPIAIDTEPLLNLSYHMK